MPNITCLKHVMPHSNLSRSLVAEVCLDSGSKLKRLVWQKRLCAEGEADLSLIVSLLWELRNLWLKHSWKKPIWFSPHSPSLTRRCSTPPSRSRRRTMIHRLALMPAQPSGSCAISARPALSLRRRPSAVICQSPTLIKALTSFWSSSAAYSVALSVKLSLKRRSSTARSTGSTSPFNAASWLPWRWRSKRNQRSLKSDSWLLLLLSPSHFERREQYINYIKRWPMQWYKTQYSHYSYENPIIVCQTDREGWVVWSLNILLYIGCLSSYIF